MSAGVLVTLVVIGQGCLAYLGYPLFDSAAKIVDRDNDALWRPLLLSLGGFAFATPAIPVFILAGIVIFFRDQLEDPEEADTRTT
jgi:hypothetical protein